MQKLDGTPFVHFQTRNPPHVAHEMLQKTSITTRDGVFVNPVIGKKKSGDFVDEVIVKCYETMIKSYYPENRCQLGTSTYTNEVCRSKRSNTSCNYETKLWLYTYHHRT